MELKAKKLLATLLAILCAQFVLCDLNELIEQTEPPKPDGELGGDLYRMESAVIPDDWNEYDLIKVRSLYYEENYDEINDVLVDNVATDGIRENMDFARKWLEKEAKSSISGIFKRSLVKALRQFTALDSIKEENKCNRNTDAILYRNNKGTRDVAHKRPSMAGPFRRIEQLIHQFNRQHALACMPIYPQILKRRSENLNKELLNRVELFQDSILKKRSSIPTIYKYNKKPEGEVNAMLDLAQTMPDFSSYYATAYESIVKLSAHDPNARYLNKTLDENKSEVMINKKKIKELFIKYLVEPCDYYVRSLGPDVFIPAPYDEAMLEDTERDELYREHQDLASLYMGWARFKICQKLIKNKDKLANDVIWYARSVTIFRLNFKVWS